MWLGFVLLAFAVGCGIMIYNRIVRRNFMVKEAFSGIDVQLKRRHELIPRLVAVTQGYLQHERTILEEVTALRGKSLTVQGVNEKGSIESGISQGIKSIFAVVENYPNLKADGAFQQLHASLVDVEEQLQLARRYYNGAVRDYNTLIQSFPGVVLAGCLGYRPAEFFEVELATERKAPAVH